MLAPRGRLVLLGLSGGQPVTGDLGPILRKRLEVIGTVMRTRTLEERVPLVREFTERMLPLFDQRIEHAAPLRPVLERTYPMTELAEAHRADREQRDVRKVVVVWDGGWLRTDSGRITAERVRVP